MVILATSLSSWANKGHSSLSRPKSLLVSSPSTKLLTLEEAQARTQAQINSPIVADSKYIEVGEGPAALQGKFHTVIDFPSERKNLLILTYTSRESKLFRPRRPRSSSDALSASFNGELLGNMNRCNSYDNLPHDDSDGDEGLIHVPALISPRSAEDVDLSPPDIGVASLDFDPMSFQCSPPQAESECLESSTSLLESAGINQEKPSLLKKDTESGSQSQTPGSATSSEPVSPFQEKMSPFFTLDLSPTEEKACKPFAFSPKLGRKPIKSPPLTTSEPVSFALPSRVSEAVGGAPITSRNSSASSWSKGIGITDITNRSPTQMSLPLKSSDTGAGEGAHQELQQAQLVAAGKPELPEEGERPMSSSQNKTVPTGHTQPGAVALDSPQDPVPVWGATAPEKPPEPTPGFVPESSSAARCSSSVPTGHQSHLEKPRETPRAPPLHLRSESVPAHSSYGFTPPVPPVRTLESKIAAAMHSNNADAINNSNYHAFLSSSMLASSVEEALLPPPPPPPPKHTSLQSVYVPHPKPESIPEPSGPEGYLHHKPASIHQYRPESVPPHVSYHKQPDQHPAYPPRSETPASAGTRYNTYTTQGKGTAALHSKPRSRTEFVSSVSPTGLRNAGYAEEAPPYPTIRRVQSLHVPTPAASAIRSVPISRTEVPPDDEPVFCPRPLYQYKPYQPHSDYHVTQLQPYFENGRVHYRYSPYSSSSASSYYTAADGSFYDLDPYSTVRVRPFHPLPSREFPSYTSRLQSKGLYRYPSLSSYPRGGLMGHLAGKEHSFISRDVPPAPDIKHMYMSWDLEDMEKYRMQSIRRESRTRQKAKGPVMSQYDNVAPLLQEELGGLDVIHLRSKSDPGKTGLLTVAEGKEGRYPAKAATPEGDDRYYGQHPEPELERPHYHGPYGNGQPEKPSLPQKQSSIRSRKLHEPGCGTNEHRTHLPQEASHRQPSEAKNGPPYPDYRPKGGPPEPSEPMAYQHSGGKYIPANQESLRLNHKEVRLAEERPDLERSRARPAAPMEKHSRDCYKEEEHAAPAMAPPPKPERSHSLRMQPPEPMERDSALLYPYQTLGKRQSTMTVVSQYDNLEDYHTMPQHQRGGYVGGGGGGGFVPPAFTHVHSRTYATALGQGAFLPTELCLQRPETEVHVE
ncbi:rho gtpase-activating protein 32 [Limosa lapponica baueri]|uniref:Rho gtpase-activating protein 32 n=1 Tax=Limosa lapponica baueri TaxID=1758121 RepID=A0A2I0T640_LIMLA|nr:rho gtpase-activating protein 32 [Limosa lapponica baueri]